MLKRPITFSDGFALLLFGAHLFKVAHFPFVLCFLPWLLELVEGLARVAFRYTGAEKGFYEWLTTAIIKWKAKRLSRQYLKK